MELTRLIMHPEEMSRETLYELRSIMALNPYYQTARLLLLQNLYILHDETFEEELRKAAIYITDRKVIFQLIEGAHYKIQPVVRKKERHDNDADRTSDIIDSFLGSMPSEDNKKKKKGRRPTPADAAYDYMSYLMETEEEQDDKDSEPATQMKGQSLIDSFLKDGGFNFKLKDDEPEDVSQADKDKQDNIADAELGHNDDTETPEMPEVNKTKSEADSSENTTDKNSETAEYNDVYKEEDDDEEDDDYEDEETYDDEDYEEEGMSEMYGDSLSQAEEAQEQSDGYFTETLARIYIKQGRYEKALEIIKRLNLNYPKKNAYFADQMRFLEKLILNNKKNK